MQIEDAAPDFVGVGVQKSGTSWWFDLVASHPGVYGDALDRQQRFERKETHFFDRFWSDEFLECDIQAYHSLFARPRGQLAGEWTPRYIFDAWTPGLLRRAARKARLLVLLRDPVDRYISGLTHSMQYDPSPPGPTLASDAINRGLYGMQVSRLFVRGPRSRC